MIGIVMVALHVRAWVEINNSANGFGCTLVALHVRAWVEMLLSPISSL